MNHDPLCSNQSEYFDGSILWPARCECELIAKIRADEREKVAQRVATLGHADGCLIESDRVGHHCDCFLRRAIAVAYGEAS